MPSSVVSAIKYDASKAILTVIFVSGMVYEYKNVPGEIYLEMKNAESKGLYLNKNIKGHYSFEKIK